MNTTEKLDKIIRNTEEAKQSVASSVSNYTIRDLLDIVSFQDIARILECVYYYEDGARIKRKEYHNIFDELKTYEKVVPKVGEKLFIKASDMDGDEKRWYTISLRKLEHPEAPYPFNLDQQDYAIDFMDWKELVDIPLSVLTIEHYTSEDIIAHFLWEITFFGYSREDVESKRKEIFSKVDEDGMIKLEINDEEPLTNLEIKKEEVK